MYIISIIFGAIIAKKTKGRMLCVRPLFFLLSCWIILLGER